MLGKAPKGFSLTPQLEGNVAALKKIMDLVWDKAVEYNRVSKGDGSSEAI